MENGCPVLPQKIKVNAEVDKVEVLIKRATQIAFILAEKDADAALSFMRNFEHLKELGDPMLEWFIESRERGLAVKEESLKEVESGEFYSF